MARVPANVSGDLVRVALMEARLAGLTTRQLVTATELSAYQGRSAQPHRRLIRRAFGNAGTAANK